MKDMVLRMTLQREEPVIATIRDRAGILSEFRNPRPAPSDRGGWGEASIASLAE